MENTALIITGNPADIAAGLQKFAERHATPRTEPEFQDQKLTVSQAAEYSDFSYKHLCKMIHEKKIRCWGSGRKRFLLRSELIEDLKNLK